MDDETLSNAEEFPKIRYEEKLLLRNCPLNIYSIGRPPAPELLREVEKRFDDRCYRLAWKHYVEMTKPLNIYLLLLLENEPGLWAKIRPSLIKLIEDDTVDEVDPEARLRSIMFIQIGDDVSALEIEKFKQVKHLFQHNEFDKAINELKREYERKHKGLPRQNDSDPADWWKG
jgi:hypothetical protein